MLNGEKGVSKHRGQVLDYVKHCFSIGMGKKEVQKKLRASGWPRKWIKELMREKEIKLKKAEKWEIPMIEVVGVSKSFGGNRVLSNVNLEIGHGEIYGIIGLSGSGKTTLLNTLVGFVRPEEGGVFFRLEKGETTRSIYKNDMEVKERFGFASQEPSFYGRLTCQENMEYFASLYNMPPSLREQNILSLLKILGLDTAKATLGRKISGGMQKRLCIACAMVHNPQILILDEPAADLDPFLRREMYSMIRRIKELGTTIIMTSHFIDEADHLCDRIAILHKGRIIEEGTPEQLKEAYSTYQEVHLETKSGQYGNILNALKKKGVKVTNAIKEENKIMFNTHDPEKALHILLRVIDRFEEQIVSLDITKPTLKEVFASVVSK